MLTLRNNRNFDCIKSCEQGALIEAVHKIACMFATRVEVSAILPLCYLLKQILTNGLRFCSAVFVLNFCVMLPKILRRFDSNKKE